MAKSFIDAVQDSPRMRLGIPIKTKNALCRTNTSPAGPPFGFELHGRLVPAYSRVRLFRHPFIRNLPRSRSPIRLNRPAAPAMVRRPRCYFYWPFLLFRFTRPSRSFAFITGVTNDSMSVQIRSHWSIRETIVLL